MAKKPEPGPRRPSAEEAALFDRAMRGARQLKPRPPGVRRAEPAPAPAKPRASARPKAPPAKPVPAATPPAGPQLVVERRAMVPGLDRRSAARLARGQLPIEARLDLHGHRQAAAHEALKGFILGSVRAERRCVLVVTGKGQEHGAPAAMGGEAPGVLKRNLPRWLAEPPLADKVLALRPATPQHGGEGAFYVLLRRRRQ
jgi:DNA-nicking Smr family endonuclease